MSYYYIAAYEIVYVGFLQPGGCLTTCAQLLDIVARHTMGELKCISNQA